MLSIRVRGLSPETNDADLMKPVENARKSLTEAIESGSTALDLAYHLNKLAEAEGHRFSALSFVRHMRSGATQTEAAHEVIADVIGGSGADDTWSGRSNDTKRAFYDGRREMASAIYDHFVRFATV